MTNHQILAFLDESRKHYGFWPGYQLMAKNLRLNTPKGETRWDSQVSVMVTSLIAQELVAWTPCPGDAPGCKHLILTEFGAQTLRAWNEHGCKSHGRAKGRCMRRSPLLMPGLEHAA